MYKQDLDFRGGKKVALGTRGYEATLSGVSMEQDAYISLPPPTHTGAGFCGFS